MTTPKDFSIALLNRLGLPVTDNRLISLVAFAAIEGGHWHNAAKYNPMNTSLPYGGSKNPGFSANIQAYRNWADGIEATARTMVQSNMKAMLDALRANAEPRAFLKAVTQTQWCPGCDYTPFDPYALYKTRANEQDGGDGLQPRVAGGIDWKPIAVAGGAVVVAGGIAWWLKNRYRGRRSAYA